MTFVHLHAHSDYSPLDGAQKIKNMVATAVALGQPAIALTDHGSMGGAFELYRQCNSQGIKPIIGMEVYVAPFSAEDKKPIYFGTPEQKRSDVSKGAYTHLTLLARNAEGLRNLYRLHDLAAEQSYFSPRIDKSQIAEHSEGLIVLSGCLGSELSVRLKLGHLADATELAVWYRDTFEHYYIEVMEHGIPEEQAIAPRLREIAVGLGIAVVPTNDAHHSVSGGAEVHDAVMCMQFFKKLSDPRYTSGTGYFLRSREEMAELGFSDTELDETLRITDLVEPYDSVFEKKLRMPTVPTVDGWDENDQLCHAVDVWHMMEHPEEADLPPLERPYQLRLFRELEVICDLGFAGYFLVEEKWVNAARKSGLITGPGRGSAGGSLVAYALGITQLDPLVFGLVFERFLNPQRASIPDIDIDICDDQHGQFKALAISLFGESYVAAIGTYGTLGAKAAIDGAARVMGKDLGVSQNLKGFLPSAKHGVEPKLSEIITVPGGVQDVYDLAVGLEGLIRSQSQHAAGVVISPEPLSGLLPLRRIKKKDLDEPGAWTGKVTAYDMGEVDSLGLVKYDRLGLRNLTNIRRVCEAVGLDYYSLPRTPEGCNDPATYNLLARGDTLGVFQLDGAGMQKLLRSLHPTEFGDISAVLALYRPGPMGVDAHNEYARRKTGRAASVPIHPELSFSFLDETYGLVIYQEQILALLSEVCGWDYGEADLLFNAMRKKDHAKLEAARPAYEAAAALRGYSGEAVQLLWETISPFADYSFNRAHSSGYGLVAYWTAWLKSTYPREYMAELLGSVNGDPDKQGEYLAEATRMGIPILTPDINSSAGGFTPVAEGIRYGLAGIRGVGDKAFEALMKGRPYSDLRDFFTRADPKVLNKGVLRALAKSGALDSFHPRRHDLVHDIERLADVADGARRARGDTLFPPTYTPIRRGVRVQQEYEEWELDTLSVLLTKKQLRILIPTPLDKSGWSFLQSTLYGGTEMEYSVLYQGVEVATGSCSLSGEAVSSLEDLGLEIEYDA